VTGFADGAALLLGLLLASAGVLKLATPRAFEHSLYRLLPARFDSVLLVRFAARAVGATELVVGGCLLAVPWASNRFAVAPAAAGAALYFAFVGVIAIAIRRGAACACWSSFSDSVAGGAELGRSIALAAIACALLAVELVSRPAGWTWTALAWLAGAVAVVAAAVVLGGRLHPELPREHSGALHAVPPGAPPADEAGAEGEAAPAPAGEPAAPARTGRASGQGARAGGFPSLLLGRIRSNNSSKPVKGLALSRRQQVLVARAVRSSQSWATVVEWLGDRAAGVRWNGAFAQETHVSEGPEGRSSYFVLSPITGVDIAVVATLRSERGTFTECVLLGTIDGGAVSVMGPVVMSGTTPIFVSPSAAAGTAAAGAAPGS
jgi:hypothetical protein